jgi:hypothetical protein
MNYKLIFLLEILAFISLSFMAVAMEGPEGGLFGKNTIYGLSADFWIFTVAIPLFLLLPIIACGFESKLFGTLAAGYFVGITLEDFFWFIVNPNFGIMKFNSKCATWLQWIRIGFFEVPIFYVSNLLIAILIWFIFIENGNKIDSIIKKYKSTKRCQDAH